MSQSSQVSTACSTVLLEEHHIIGKYISNDLVAAVPVVVHIISYIHKKYMLALKVLNYGCPLSLYHVLSPVVDSTSI
jgi:hypothetical protein